MTKIYLEHFHKKFSSTTAVDDLTLEVKDRELLVFLGPSGCGKSTTLNCIAGIEEPTSGHIYFDDHDVTNWPAYKRNTAMVFQSALLYPHLTAWENIRMSLRIINIPNQEKDKKIKEVANLLKIDKLLDKLPSELSGGERQRVATAKAIVRNPTVFLMDEPLASLDAGMREFLRSEIVRLNKRLSITMVFVTHDQVEAMTMGDRIAVMLEGKLQQVGTPDDIYNTPVNTFVASFVGTPPMNLFEGNIIKKSGNEYLFKSESFYLKIPKLLIKCIKEPLGDRRSVILGARPQNITLFEKSSEGAVAGQIFNVEKLGKETIVIIEYNKGESRFKTIADSSFSKSMGDIIFALPQAEHLYLFDPNSGMNLCVSY